MTLRDVISPGAYQLRAEMKPGVTVS